MCLPGPAGLLPSAIGRGPLEKIGIGEKNFSPLAGAPPDPQAASESRPRGRGLGHLTGGWRVPTPRGAAGRTEGGSTEAGRPGEPRAGEREGVRGVAAD